MSDLLILLAAICFAIMFYNAISGETALTMAWGFAAVCYMLMAIWGAIKDRDDK